MAALAPCYSWWRYPVKGPKERTLDHTTLTGKKRAVYPVRRFTKEEREAYVLQAWGGHYDVVEIRGKPPEKRTITKWSRLSFGQKAAGRILLDALPLEPPLRSLWRTAVPPTDWRYTFLGQLARRVPIQYVEPKPPKGLFGEARKLVRSDGKRKARKVPPRFKEGWLQDRSAIYGLIWRSYQRRSSNKWKPPRQYYFDAWEQNRFVPRTALPRPSMANLRDFLAQRNFYSIG
jgi:hypothetical protein